MPEHTIKTKFYRFYQNNSGGHWENDDKSGIGYIVWIEAVNADDANQRAKKIGIYFDGVDKGVDCDCCGDRWYKVMEVDIYAYDEVPIQDYLPDSEGKKGRSPTLSKMYSGQSIYIHAFDGSVSRIKRE